MIPERSEAFFVRENGERLYKNLVYNLVKRNLSKVVTLKKRSPHVLRHTFATTMLNNDAELGAVKRTFRSREYCNYRDLYACHI